jgi:hypothetical protein
MALRWKYVIAPTPEEIEKRERMIAAMDAFWDLFKEKFEPFFNGGESNLTIEERAKANSEMAEELASKLVNISPRLYFEIGPNHDGSGGRRLTITSEGAVERFQLIKYMLAHAPTFPNWVILDHRPPVPFDDAMRLTKTRCKAETVMNFEIEVVRAPHNTIDLTFYSRSCEGEDDKRAEEQAFVLTEYLLGEEFLNIWRNNFKVKPLSFWGALFKHGRVRPEQLKATVDDLIRTMQNELPKKPFDTEHWHPAEIDPETGKTNVGRAYRLSPRNMHRPDVHFWDDLASAFSNIPALWEITHEARRYYDARFSRCGEVLAFLKIGRNTTSETDAIEVRHQQEEALDERLKELGIGITYGGGTGHIYSYIELILTDVGAAIPIIRAVLQELKVSRRSWLLFHDTALYYEWVGIWDDTGVPPGLEEA